LVFFGRGFREIGGVVSLAEIIQIEFHNSKCLLF
jgi:hypothetical protein